MIFKNNLIPYYKFNALLNAINAKLNLHVYITTTNRPTSCTTSTSGYLENRFVGNSLWLEYHSKISGYPEIDGTPNIKIVMHIINYLSIRDEI
jgi:hypothetical protein